jgi:SAM-dependent methyltransferase
MGLRFFTKLGPLKRIVFRCWLGDARAKETQFRDFLRPGDRILDLGSGPGSVCLLLRSKGFAVTPVDIQDAALDARVKPLLYDGRRLPFTDDAFDVALLLTVLHHAHDPAAVLAEAGRVARRVIVIEDVYRSTAQMYLTWWADSLLNLEFRGHPHANRPDGAWRRHFAAHGWQLVHTRSRRIAGLFQQQTYVLDAARSPATATAILSPAATAV